MTTIAYKDGIIAYDSRATKGSTIWDDNFDKHIERDGIHFFMSESLDKFDDIINAWFGKDFNKDICPSCGIMVWDGETLWEFSTYKSGRLSKCRNAIDVPLALGSGEDHAITAMDMGASAKEAIEMAMKRNIATGGKIRTFNITQEFKK